MDASPACFVCFDERLDNICGNCSDSDTGRKAEVRKLSSLPERRLPNIWGRRSMRANPPRRWFGPVHQSVPLPTGLLLRASVDRFFSSAAPADRPTDTARPQPENHYTQLPSRLRRFADSDVRDRSSDRCKSW